MHTQGQAVCSTPPLLRTEQLLREIPTRCMGFLCNGKQEHRTHRTTPKIQKTSQNQLAELGTTVIPYTQRLCECIKNI